MSTFNSLKRERERERERVQSADGFWAGDEY
jgi:hypothetical protein